MRIRLTIIFALIAGLGLVSGKRLAQVSIPVTCMRALPGHDKEQTSQAVLGTPVEVLAEQQGWYKVRTPDNYTGFVKGNTISIMSEEESSGWPQAERVVCRKWMARLYDNYGQPAGYAPYGAILLRLSSAEREKIRVAISGSNDRYWIEKADVWSSTDEWLEAVSSSGVEEVLGTAFTMLGAPYLWGGTSTLAPDCSGFTQIAFRAAGMLLPRDTSMQIKCGTEVATLEEALPGDLIFYGNKGQVNHVAIYLGDYRIIHSSGHVRVCRMRPDGDQADELYADIPMAIRRVLGVPSQKPGEAAPGVPSIEASDLYFGN